MHIERLILIVSLILLAALSRLLPHPQNVAPIAAIALFAGAYLRGWLAFAIPLAAMLVSDVVIGFHDTMPFVYAGMVITVCLGMALLKQPAWLRVAGASVLASVIFFVLTNVGVWASGGMYTMDANGLAQCFTLALPFFANSLLGDLMFAAILFGVFKLAEKRMLPAASAQ